MEPAWAKLNLSLDVLGARPDGFHDLRMVMQSVDLHDDVTVTLDDTGTCRAETNRSYLPCGADNVAVRAAQVFLARAGLTCGVHIRLHKRIPVCAGLGGGSSDAAAVLRALERLTGAGFTRTQLEEMGAEIGSDVPYCVAGGTVLAEGRGERLTPVTPMPRLPVVICKPDFPISTPELFHRVDARTSRCRPDTEGICAALADGDMPRLARRMYNVFEDVLTHREGEIAAIKSRLLDGGALGAVITYTPNIKSMVFTVAGALVLLIGLRMAGILPGLRPSETELPGACSLNARTRRRFAGQPLIIGLLTGVMPCGALSAMWLYAMSSGSAVRGALVMLVFSLGTVPLLFLFGALQSFLPRGWMKYIVKGSAVLVVTLGLSMLVKGIRLFGM